MTFFEQAGRVAPCFPIRDHNPSERTPYVTWALIALNIGIFLSYWSLFSDERAISNFFYHWGLVPRAASPETFLTSMFLHGGFMHLAGNMLFLWIFGDNMEDQMGHIGFGMFYLACGLAAAFAQVASAPDSSLPMVGASGAIAGVMGGYLLLFPKARVDIFFFYRMLPVPAWIVLAFWFGLQVFQGSTLTTEAGGVAYWAHAGGFAAGLLMTVAALAQARWSGLLAAHAWPSAASRGAIPKRQDRHSTRGPASALGSGPAQQTHLLAKRAEADPPLRNPPGHRARSDPAADASSSPPEVRAALPERDNGAKPSR